MTDLSNKIALITGASRGIGAAVAKAYAKAGAHVILTARTVGGLEAIDDEIRRAGGNATLVPLDLNALDKIDVLGPHIAEKFGRLDILVGNAGMLGTLSPVSHIKAAEWEQVFRINVHANYRLIRTCDPLLQQSAAGRAMFVTSGAVQSTKAYWSAYAASKAALEAMVKSYAAEIETTNLKVNLIDPGRVRTAMRAKAYPGEDPMSRPAPEEIVQVFLDLADEECDKQGARVEAY